MILGLSFLSLALLATIVAALLFVASERVRSGGGLAVLGRRFAVGAALLVICASVELIYLFATHQFQFTYVADYSSRTSQARYLLAAFWGGQEGSILLWTLCTAILGAILAYRAGGKEARVWPFFAILQSLLLILVLAKSPFRVMLGAPPADGTGLNPLLENQWMVIHPPVLFLGFASLALPWVWAVYGLVYKDWDGWMRRALPWAVFSFAVHGFGVALGGYWAYETLGWGGFWGWDPVENSSLVPWLFMIGLLHGILLQKANGGFKVSNFLLAALPFGFMCYGTFLTRSGILADFSVHSFVSLGKDGFALLLGDVLFAFVLPLILLFVRFREIPKPTSYSTILTREFGLFLASVVLGMLGLLTALGMSAPLITRLWMVKGAGAPPEFYNQATYPMALLMLVVMAVTPFLAWRSSEPRTLSSKLLPAYIAAVLAAVIVFALGGRKPWMLLLIAASVFAGVTNLVLVWDRLSHKPMRLSAGGFAAHLGAAMLLAGIGCLVCFSKTAQHISLLKDSPIEALGYKLTYLGETSQPFDRGNALRVRVERDGRSWEATPKLFITPWEGQDRQFANPPDIRNFLWGDLYLAYFHGPVSLNPQSPINGVTLHQGDSFTFGDYTFNFRGVTWADDVMAAMKTGGMEDFEKLPSLRMHANLDVTYQGQVYPIKPEFVFDQQTMAKHAVPAALPGAPNAIVVISDVQLPSTITIDTPNLPDPYEMVQLDLSTKPGIWLVWMGTFLYTIGGLIALRRRSIEFAAEEPDEDLAAPSLPTTGKTKRRSVKL